MRFPREPLSDATTEDIAWFWAQIAGAAALALFCDYVQPRDLDAWGLTLTPWRPEQEPMAIYHAFGDAMTAIR